MSAARCLTFLVVLFLALPARAEPPALHAARGTVERADKDALAIRPRKPDGKLDRGITLTVTGTSRVTTLATQMRDGKPVFAQRDAAVKDLAKRAEVAVIYADGPDGPVLLSAVVLPASAEKE
jgi:hypothetical protein